MKKFFLILTVLVLSDQSYAQFTKASLQATGLTCAMCSNAVNKALQKVSFVESVRSDIKNSSFAISFKKDLPVNLDALKDAVEDAGFSIGSLTVTGTFNDLKIEADQHVKIGADNFHFLKVKNTVLHGDATFTLLDKNFVSAKEFKKHSADTKKTCLKNGKAASCCVKEGGMAEGERVYHITM